MFNEGRLDKILRKIKGYIPKSVFDAAAKVYHPLLAFTGALVYRFPSKKLKVIGVTGTKGKSTTVFMISRILEHALRVPQGKLAGVAAIGSLGYKIKSKEWPNTLKMTMPGRWKLQKFLRAAVDAGCTHVVIECPSEGLAQGRHLGVEFDCAVFTNLHPEHLESHGSFENYRAAKQILFAACPNIHVVNRDDPSADYFLKFPAKKHLTFGIAGGDVMATEVFVTARDAKFTVGRTRFNLRLGGLFNISNALAAVTVADAYGVSMNDAKEALERIDRVAGRMDWVTDSVVVDYAHTPDSLEAVYKALRPQAKRLICVLGAAGGGRDVWKRPKFGALAERFCDRIYLTDEDPYDENPEQIVQEIRTGITDAGKVTVVMDRRDAIKQALTDAGNGDIVVITGKGSETSMALAGGKKISWSDADIVRSLLKER